MNILFFGSSDYSYECLKALIKSNNVIGIVTKSDSYNSKNEPIPTFIKKKMKGTKIPIFQPQDIKDNNFINIVKELNPDLIVTAAYGQYLPNEILEIPKHKSINIHASYLPEYQGASPITKVIEEGRTETGITSIIMTDQIDGGDIICQEKIKIDDNETFESLYSKFLKIIPGFTLKTIDAIKNNATLTPQDISKATYIPKIDLNEDTKIDWNTNCIDIERKIRAYYPKPGTYCFLGDRKFKIYKATTLNIYHEHKPGTIVRVDKDFFRVACKVGYIDIYEIQIPGKKKCNTRDFINGNHPWLSQMLAKMEEDKLFLDF